MCAGQINQSCPFRSATPGVGPAGPAPLVTRPHKCLGAGTCAQFRGGPPPFSRFEARENRRDPTPTLADVYQRENERSFPLPQVRPSLAPTPASPSPRAPAPAASIAANVVAALNRLYNAAKLADVTGSPAPASAPAPAPQHNTSVLLSKSARGAVIDILT